MPSPRTYAGIVEASQPNAEPLNLATAKKFLRLPDSFVTDDYLINDVIIPGARKQLETMIGVTLASRNFVQYENGFPFFPYFQSPYAPLFGAAFPFYFGYGPIASYPYPAIGGLQNQLISPFDIMLLRSPVTAVDHIAYIGTDGNAHTLLPGQDFTVAFGRQPCMISPIPGQRWPVGILGNSTVEIHFTAGYQPPTPTVDADDQVDITEPSAPNPPNQITEYKFEIGIPPNLNMALLQLVVHWYQNRDSVITGAGAGGKHETLPNHLQEIIDSERNWQF